MKRQYDFPALALRHGFNDRDVEKACRISDLLEDISAVKFLSERLSLYGGTARAARNLLQTERLPELNITKITKRATEFTNTQLKKLTNNEKEMIDQFWSKGIFKPELINHKNTFHTNIAEYPAVLWTLKKPRKTKPPENSPSSSKSQTTKPHQGHEIKRRKSNSHSYAKTMCASFLQQIPM